MTRLLFLSLVACSGCSASAPSSRTSTAVEHKRAGGSVGRIALRSDGGSWVRLGHLLGEKVVLVTFWATWCSPCVAELGHLAKIQHRLGTQGLQVVAVNTDPPAFQGRARAVARRANRGGELLVLLDQESILIRELNPRASLPYYVIFDRKGELEHSHQGYQPGDERAIEARLIRLLELKHYRRFRFGRNDKPALLYHEPPSLERFDQQVPNNSNVLGGRLRLSVDLVGGRTAPFVNVLAYALNDQVDEALLDGKNSRAAYHLYAGVEQKIGPVGLKISAGFREDRWLDESKEDPTWATTAQIKRRVFRTDGSLSVPMGRHSLDAKWEHRTELKPLFSSDSTFHKGRLTITYGFGGVITLAALLSWDWDPEDDDPIKPPLLGGGEATLHFSSWAMLKLFGGGLHGGLVCVSGSCRQLPSFLGARSELVLRL